MWTLVKLKAAFYANTFIDTATIFCRKRYTKWTKNGTTITEYKQSQLTQVSVFAEEGTQTSDSDAGPARGVKRDCDASDGSDKRPKL